MSTYVTTSILVSNTHVFFLLFFISIGRFPMTSHMSNFTTASLFPIGSSNDISIEDEKYDSFHSSPNNTSDGQQLVETRIIGTNSTAVSPTVSPLFEFEAITLDIDCKALLKQMIEEASTVVSLAVEHTNRTWKNKMKMQHELDTTRSSLALAAAAAVAAGPPRPAMAIAKAPAPAPS